MNVYTWYEPVEGLSNLYDGLWDIFAESWRRHGWNPRLLNLAVAKKHPDFYNYYDIVSQQPTINPRAYDTGDKLRWLAYEQALATEGPGIMIDMDAINYGFVPGDVQFDKDKLYCLGAATSIHASKENAEELVSMIANFVCTGLDHASDMNIFYHFRNSFNHLGIEKIFLQPNWESAKIIHYANNPIVKHFGKMTNKAEAIKKLNNGKN